MLIQSRKSTRTIRRGKENARRHIASPSTIITRYLFNLRKPVQYANSKKIINAGTKNNSYTKTKEQEEKQTHVEINRKRKRIGFNTTFRPLESILGLGESRHGEQRPAQDNSAPPLRPAATQNGSI
jgi:hypothetical protein